MPLYNRLDEFLLMSGMGLEELPTPSDILFSFGRDRQVAFLVLRWHTDEWHFEVEVTCDGNVFYKEARKEDLRWCYLLRPQFIPRVKERAQKVVSMDEKVDRDSVLDKARKFLAGTNLSYPL